jgi:hypothetical protein
MLKVVTISAFTGQKHFYFCAPNKKYLKMKKLLIFALGLSVMVACNSNQTEETVEEETAAAYEVYGDTSLTPDGALSGEEVLAMLAEQDSVQVKVKGTIVECCQKKGCWMEVDLGTETALVTFMDYGFFVPMDAAGREVIMEGQIKREVQSVEWLQHKAEDAGATEEEIAAITEPEERYAIVATGVIIQ